MKPSNKLDDLVIPETPESQMPKLSAITGVTNILAPVSNTRSKDKIQNTKQFRFWFVTDYCENKHEYDSSSMEYYTGQQEQCPTTNKKHWQCMVILHKRVNSILIDHHNSNEKNLL